MQDMTVMTDFELDKLCREHKVRCSQWTIQQLGINSCFDRLSKDML